MDEGVCKTKSVTLIAKWGKERITLDQLDRDTSIGTVKELLSERTGVLQKQQKLIHSTTANASFALPFVDLSLWSYCSVFSLT
jgi:hypothetical protein